MSVAFLLQIIETVYLLFCFIHFLFKSYCVCYFFLVQQLFLFSFSFLQYPQVSKYLYVFNSTEALEGKKKHTCKEESKRVENFGSQNTQNLSIFLGQYGMPYEEIKNIILEVNEDVLNEPLIQNLVKQDCYKTKN